MGGTSQRRTGTRLSKASSRHAVAYAGRVVYGISVLDALYRRIPCRSLGSLPFSKPLQPSAAIVRIQKSPSGGISPLSSLGFAWRTTLYLCPVVQLATKPGRSATPMLTNGNSNVANVVGQDRNKVRAQDCQVMIVDTEDVIRVQRGIDNPQEILLALQNQRSTRTCLP